MRFEKLNLSHIEAVKKAVIASGHETCQLSAASIYCYAEKYGTAISVAGGMFIKQNRPGFGECYFCPIVPAGELSGALSALFAYHAQNGQGAFKIWGVTDEILAEFEQATAGLSFEKITDRDWAEYVHTRESLTNMKGKRFHAKKNAVNQFIRNNSDFSYEAIDNSNISEVADFQARLLAGVKKFERDAHRAQTLIEEDEAIRRGLGNYEALGLEGGIIRIEGNVCAYAFGGAITDTVFDITFEKALREYNGIFQVLEQEMLKHNLSGYEYINREEDLGDAGMRAAKERLRPDKLLMKYHFISD